MIPNMSSKFVKKGPKSKTPSSEILFYDLEKDKLVMKLENADMFIMYQKGQ